MSSTIKSTAFRVPEIGVSDILMSFRMPVEVSLGFISICWRTGEMVRGMESMARVGDIKIARRTIKNVILGTSLRGLQNLIEWILDKPE